MDDWITVSVFIVKTAEHYSSKSSLHKSQVLNKSFLWLLLIQWNLHRTQKQQRIISENSDRKCTDLPSSVNSTHLHICLISSSVSWG